MNLNSNVIIMTTLSCITRFNDMSLYRNISSYKTYNANIKYNR